MRRAPLTPECKPAQKHSFKLCRSARQRSFRSNWNSPKLPNETASHAELSPGKSRRSTRRRRRGWRSCGSSGRRSPARRSSVV